MLRQVGANHENDLNYKLSFKSLHRCFGRSPGSSSICSRKLKEIRICPQSWNSKLNAFTPKLSHGQRWTLVQKKCNSKDKHKHTHIRARTQDFVLERNQGSVIIFIHSFIHMGGIHSLHLRSGYCMSADKIKKKWEQKKRKEKRGKNRTEGMNLISE